MDNSTPRPDPLPPSFRDVPRIGIDLERWMQRAAENGNGHAAAEITAANEEIAAAIAPSVDVKSGESPVRSHCLADSHPQPVQVLVPHWIVRSGYTLLIGDPGGGKSVFAGGITAGITVGKTPNGQDMPKGRVAYFAPDENEWDTQKRLERMGADIGRVQVLDEIDGVLPEIPRHISEITSWLIEKRIDLFIIDTLADTLPGGFSGATMEAMQVAKAINAMAVNARCAIMATEHMPKSRQSIALAGLGLGSIKLAGRAQTCIVCAPIPGEVGRYAAVQTKARGWVLGTVPSQSYGWEGDRFTWGQPRPDLTAETLLGLTSADSMARDRQSKRQEATTWLREMLAHGEWVEVDWLERMAVRQLGCARATFWRARKDLSTEIEERHPGTARNVKQAWRLTNASQGGGIL